MVDGGRMMNLEGGDVDGEDERGGSGVAVAIVVVVKEMGGGFLWRKEMEFGGRNEGGGN